MGSSRMPLLTRADRPHLRTRHTTRRVGVRPDSPDYRPDSPVFYHRTRSGTYQAITFRRFDTLHGRWQKELGWAAEEQVGYHHLRHIISHELKTRCGPPYAKRYLRHSKGDVTDTYGACNTAELARALSDLFEYEHPLVDGIDQRRVKDVPPVRTHVVRRAVLVSLNAAVLGVASDDAGTNLSARPTDGARKGTQQRGQQKSAGRCVAPNPGVLHRSPFCRLGNEKADTRDWLAPLHWLCHLLALDV